MRSAFPKILLVLVIGVVIMVGCKTNDSTEQLSDLEPANLPSLTTLTNCKPQPVSPPYGTLIEELQPTLTWTYPDSCNPDNYRISIWTNSTDGGLEGTSFGGVVTTQKSWTVPVPLQVGVGYVWQVVAKNATHQSYSWLSNFVVGPPCEYDSLVAPIPLEPPDGSEYTGFDRKPDFAWDYAETSCALQGYHLQVAEDAEFNNIVINLREETHLKYAAPEVMLDKCHTYFWRVAATDGDDDGPWSAVASFFMNTEGACEELLAPPSAWPKLKDLVCYSGPNPELYPKTGGYLLVGERTEIYGRNMRGDWIAVQDPDNVKGVRCYLRLEDIETSVDPVDLKILNDPPITRPTEALACSKELNKEQCKAAGGTWVKVDFAGASSYYCQCE